MHPGPAQSHGNVHDTVPQLSAHHLDRIEVALHSAASVFTTAQRISAPFEETGHLLAAFMIVESCRL